MVRIIQSTSVRCRGIHYSESVSGSVRTYGDILLFYLNAESIEAEVRIWLSGEATLIVAVWALKVTS